MASLGIANLCVMAMQEEGTSSEDARAKIWMVDSKGLIVKDRPEGGVTGHKVHYAQVHAPIKNLDEVVRTVKPTVLIGAAAIGGVFTPQLLKQMATLNKRPIIFALSNPTHKAECTAEDAYTHTEGKAVFASGSPFPPVVFNGQTHYPGQGNNSYIFPGVALGVICAGIRHISDEVFLIAAETLAALVTEDDLEKGSLYPPLTTIKDCSLKIAAKIAEYAYKKGFHVSIQCTGLDVCVMCGLENGCTAVQLWCSRVASLVAKETAFIWIASVYPEPKDKEAFVKAQLYDYHYDQSVLPPTYPWPEVANML
uniref:Malic enzyme NAD-binding domain-containing protein n=1 Tax=Timema genevievae TaxID=629358 RepID=A0A7R9K1P2_TIMGE|nr:unnamed protein product [Timema genevievae]